MVQIIKENRKPTFGEQFSKSIGPALENASKFMMENQENAALEKQYGLKLAGIRDPQTRQQLIADQLTYGRRAKQAEGAQNVNYGINGEDERTPQGRSRFMEEMPTKRGELPEFGRNQPKARMNEAKDESQEGYGSLFEPAIEGGKMRILSPKEEISEGKRISEQMTRSGTPTTPLQGIDIARNMNQQNKQYNQELDIQKEQIAQKELTYGDLGVSQLRKVMASPTPEQEALFQRKGEEAARAGKSQSEVNKILAQEAKDFKNQIANIKKDIPARRAFSGQGFMGTARDADKKRNDLRVKLKPLLDAGLTDTARNLLTDLDYYPEEIESIITDLGEYTKKSVAELPKMTELARPIGTSYRELGAKRVLNEDSIRILNDNVLKTLKADPKANLVLLRKAYEDKGVDWQHFKDSLNEAVLSGEVELNPDQLSQMNVLDTPPLNTLQKILHGLNLRGR